MDFVQLGNAQAMGLVRLDRRIGLRHERKYLRMRTDEMKLNVYGNCRGPGGVLTSSGQRSINNAMAGARVYRINQARSEEHTSEIQSLMRITYAVFCWKK